MRVLTHTVTAAEAGQPVKQLLLPCGASPAAFSAG